MSLAPAEATALASLTSGALVAGVAYWQARRIVPAQRRELEASAKEAKINAEKAAVDIVETALRIAQERIGSLETQIATLTERIDRLREDIRDAVGDRERLQARLDVALTQRAELQQRVVDLSRFVTDADALNAAEADAIVIARMDLEGTITYATDGIFGLLGYSPRELIGRPVHVLVPDALRDKHSRDRMSYADDPRVREMGRQANLYARRRDGVNVPVDISLHPTGDGRVISLMKRREGVELHGDGRELRVAAEQHH